MGFFNFIETFFFLSLGITFVLILLLVYHFKQRLTTLENKCDTVFEIISNLVKEVSNIKQIQISQYAMTSSNFQNSNTIIPSFHNTEINGKIKISDEEFDNESEDEDDGSEDDGSEDDGSDDDGSDDDGSDDDMPPLISIEEPIHNSTIKVINVEIGDTIEADILETDVETDILDNDENKLEPIELQEEEQIHVEKLHETASLDNNDNDSVSRESSKDIYSKMSVSELKALVITKGLSSDPSKKKKNELLKMLENNEN
jgi:hypothetical protein